MVPFTPGGPGRHRRRACWRKRSATRSDRQIIIDNRPGAGGIIGAEIVMNAKPDGYTLFYGSSGPMGILPKLHKNLSYDPVKNFVPIAAIAVSPLVLLIPPGKPYKNFKEFADYAKKNPDQLTFSSVGIGSTQHLGGELLSLAHRHQDDPRALQGIGAGGDRPARRPHRCRLRQLHAEQGQHRRRQADPAGVAAEKRLTSLPDVPTIGELGYPDVIMASWSSFAAPAGTPQPVIDKLASVIGDVTMVRRWHQNSTRCGLDDPARQCQGQGAGLLHQAKARNSNC